jgi:hypothetical protein
MDTVEAFVIVILILLILMLTLSKGMFQYEGGLNFNDMFGYLDSLSKIDIDFKYFFRSSNNVNSFQDNMFLGSNFDNQILKENYNNI